ncbi:hypothetical protein C8R47DRAFT_1084336 [Mycena vitilis]|nr:hypothetical protein C8R47DRAFT_1084336 [Mycena vitilis]
MPLADVMNLVEDLAKSNVLRTVADAKTIVKESYLVDSQSNTQGSSSEIVKLRAELSDQLSIFSEDISKLKDAQVVAKKETNASINKIEERLDSNFNRLEESMKQMTRALKPNAPHQEINLPGMTSNRDGQDRGYRNQGPSQEMKEGNCFYCFQNGHLVRDCPYKKEHIDMGRIKIENGRMRLGDGTAFPRWPDTKSQKLRVDDYYAGKAVPGAPHVFVQAYVQPVLEVIQAFHVNMPDDLNLVYDVREDENRTQLVQAHIRNNQVRYEPPSTIASYQNQVVPPENGPAQSYAPVSYPQFQQTQYQVPSFATGMQPQHAHVQAEGLSIAQLIQVMNALKANEVTTPNAQDQFAQTRQDGSRKAAETGKQPRTNPTEPPEDRAQIGSDKSHKTSATKGSNSGNWRKKDSGIEVVMTKRPEKRTRFQEPPVVEKAATHVKNRDDRQLDDERSRNEPVMPYKNVPELVHKDGSQREKSPEPNIPVQHGQERKDSRKENFPRDDIPAKTKEKAYRLIRPVDRAGTADKVLSEIWKSKIDMELGDLVQVSSSLAEMLRKSVTRVRKRPKGETLHSLYQESAFPYMEEDLEVELRHDAMEIRDLPVMDSFWISNEKDSAFDPSVKEGNIMFSDPYLVYLAGGIQDKTEIADRPKTQAEFEKGQYSAQTLSKGKTRPVTIKEVMDEDDPRYKGESDSEFEDETSSEEDSSEDEDQVFHRNSRN